MTTVRVPAPSPTAPAVTPAVERRTLTPRPRTGLSPLTNPALRAEPQQPEPDRTTTGRSVAPPAVPSGPARADREHPSISPRFDFAPTIERSEPGGSWRRRILQGALLLGIAAGTGALVLTLPNQDDPTETAAARIETVGGTRAAASPLLDESTRPEPIGSLDDAGDLALNLTAFAAPAPLDGHADGFMTEVVEAEELATAAQPTTTVFVEPTIPPESEWVDSGNGVMVPDLLLRIRFCESTNNYQAANSASSARGAYQFLTKSWEWYGHAGLTGVAEAHLATPAQQDQAALRTLQSEGTRPWLASRSCWSDENIDPDYATAVPPQPTTTTTDAGSTSTSADTATTDTTDPSTTTDSSSDTSTSTSETTTTTTESTTTPTTTEDTTTEDTSGS